MSGVFDIDKFIEYVNGKYEFPRLPEFVNFRVKTMNDINQILSEPRRKYYIDNGMMSFRGQPRQYTFKRKIPNPVRSDRSGQELSILPGIYRQAESPYSFNRKIEERKSFQYFLRELEPNNRNVIHDSWYAYDSMRVEQHYATQTAGLDITFDVETAIFFATHQFKINKENRAYYEKVKKGNDSGVIYCFVFGTPAVKRTEYLIKGFDLFKTYWPERVIRQACGLPLFGGFERNISITDLDCIIFLEEDFDYEGKKTPKYMFPHAQEDRFYGKLIELKQRYPVELENVVEYE